MNIITTIAGTGIMGYNGDSIAATNAKLNFPEQLCLDRFGNMYVADAENNRVRKIVLSTGIITTVVGSDSLGFSGDGGAAINARINLPDAVCTDISGNIYFADVYNNRIRKITVSTGIITTVVGNGLAGNYGDNGQATNAAIQAVAGMCFDKYGNMYLGDIWNHNVRKVAPNGIITTIAGNGIQGNTGDGGPATAAEFDTPGDIGIDSVGNVIITDSHQNVVRKVDAATGIVHTIAGNGTAGHSGDGGLAVNALVNGAYGIFITKQNDILICENAVIRKIDGATGIISTIVGCDINGFSGDGGLAINAEIQPDDVFLDSLGTMYIADFLNSRIRMVYNPQLSVQQPKSNTEISVYPNPAHDGLTIERAANCEVSVIDVLGKVVFSTSVFSDKEVFDIGGLRNGVYCLQVINVSGERTTVKFVKE